MTKDIAERRRQLTADGLRLAAQEYAAELRRLANAAAVLADEADARAQAPTAETVADAMPTMLKKLASVSRKPNDLALDNTLRAARAHAMRVYRLTGASWETVGAPIGMAKQNAQSTVSEFFGAEDTKTD